MAKFNLDTSEEFAQALDKLAEKKKIDQGDILVMALGDLMVLERIRNQGYKLVIVDKNDVILHDYVPYENSPTNKKDFSEMLNSLE